MSAIAVLNGGEAATALREAQLLKQHGEAAHQDGVARDLTAFEALPLLLLISL